MKNLRVSAKLMVGFLVAVMLTAVVGGVGIYGLMRAADSSARMYDVNTLPLPYIAKVAENIHELRVYVRAYARDDDEPSYSEPYCLDKTGKEPGHERRNY